MRRATLPHCPEPKVADIDALRRGIDDLDSGIVSLINERAANAIKIGALKAKEGVKPYSSSRRIGHKKGGRAEQRPDEALKGLLRNTSATIALERPMRVAFFGKHGTLHDVLAARTKFGSSVEYIPAKDMREVFSCVARGEADYGLVPIENSTEGRVNQAIDMFADTKLKIASGNLSRRSTITCCARANWKRSS